MDELFEKLQELLNIMGVDEPIYIDLGLPSGTLWADRNVSEEESSTIQLPTYEQAQELIEFCNFQFRETQEGNQFVDVQGPNGLAIRFSLAEHDEVPMLSACSWCSSTIESNPEFGHFMILSPYTITIGASLKNEESTIGYRGVKKKE